MSLVGKFGNFEVKQTDRISQEDKVHLERWKEKYERALCIHKAVYDVFRKEWENYTEEDLEDFQYSGVLLDDYGTIKKIDSLQDEFVEHIFSYFSRKYNVSLNNDLPKSNLANSYYRYSRKTQPKELVFDFIDYHTVVDKIIDQLGGMSFQDKAIKEIKDALKKKCYNSYRDEWEIQIKGNKLIYKGGYCSPSWSSYHFNSTEFMTALLHALSFNTYGEKVHLYELNRLYDSYYIDLQEDDFTTGFSCKRVGVEHIKFFKNGRVDITFKDAEFARNFAREWCGYTLI